MSNEIFTIWQMLENMLEHEIETYHLFKDFRMAYDSIIREKLYEAMQEFKFPRKLIKLTEMMMGKIICAIKLGNETSDTSVTCKGLRQGDALACNLFNLALEKIFRGANVWTRGTIYNKSTQLLVYVHDIDIVGRTLRVE
jgi:hypothetical protein